MSDGTITISTEEYNELLETKQAFLDMVQLKKKAGSAYNKYKELADADAYYERSYGEVYRQMKQAFVESRGILQEMSTICR